MNQEETIKAVLKIIDNFKTMLDCTELPEDIISGIRKAIEMELYLLVEQKIKELGK